MESLRLKDILLDQSEALFAADAEAIPREISLRQHLELPEISVLTGVRRCGKSTLLRQLALPHPIPAERYIAS
jgi:predicted AAA+ superfamily ATPase